MTYRTSVAYVATGGQTQFDVTFPYLDPSHVAARVNNVPSSYTWVSPTRVKLNTPATEGAAVVLRRATPIDQALVTFENGATLSKEDLNTATLQVLYLQQELMDLYSDGLGSALIRLGDNLGVVASPEDLLNELVQSVLANELLADLNGRIAELDTQATTLIEEILRGNDVKQGQTVIRDQVRTLTTAQGTTTTVLDLLADLSSDGLSLVLHEDTVKRENGDTLAQTFTAIETSVGDARAYTDTQITTIAGPSGTLTRLTTALGAYDLTSGGFILNDLSIKDSHGVVTANAFSGLNVRMQGVEAGIISTNTAVATEASARASAITALTASISGFSASITSLQSVDTAFGAKWSVALDVNGHISGLVTNNNGSTANFAIVADNFYIVSPSGGTPIAPFQVVSGFASFAQPIQVYSVGTAYKLVLGPAFGASHDLVLWFGPSSIAISACTRANAIMCLCTDGTVVVPTTGGSGGMEVSADVPAVAKDFFITSGTTVTLTTPLVTLTTTGAVGTPTYHWQAPAGLTATNPSGHNTAFTGTVGFGQTIEGFAVCTVTDPSTGIQRQVSIYAAISEDH